MRGHPDRPGLRHAVERGRGLLDRDRLGPDAALEYRVLAPAEHAQVAVGGTIPRSPPTYQLAAQHLRRLVRQPVVPGIRFGSVRLISPTWSISRRRRIGHADGVEVRARPDGRDVVVPSSCRPMQVLRGLGLAVVAE